MLAVVQWHQIIEVIWVSILAGSAVMVLFSLVVYGTSRASEARRDGANATFFGLLAGVCLIGFLGIAVFAITVILNKN